MSRLASGSAQSATRPARRSARRRASSGAPRTSSSRVSADSPPLLSATIRSRVPSPRSGEVPHSSRSRRPVPLREVGTVSAGPPMPEDSGKSSGIAVPGLVPSLADATEPSEEPPVVGPPADWSPHPAASARVQASAAVTSRARCLMTGETPARAKRLRQRSRRSRQVAEPLRHAPGEGDEVVARHRHGAVGGEAELGDGAAVAHDRHQERERLAVVDLERQRPHAQVAGLRGRRGQLGHVGAEVGLPALADAVADLVDEGAGPAGLHRADGLGEAELVGVRRLGEEEGAGQRPC